MVRRRSAGLLKQLPRLCVICANGAGVNQLFVGGLDPPNVPHVRLVDRLMSEHMASDVLTAVLQQPRQLGRYRERQRKRVRAR